MSDDRTWGRRIELVRELRDRLDAQADPAWLEARAFGTTIYDTRHDVQCAWPGCADGISFLDVLTGRSFCYTHALIDAIDQRDWERCRYMKLIDGTYLATDVSLAADGLAAIACALVSDVARLSVIINGLRRGSCWCDAGIGNPMMHGTHSAVCDLARAATTPEDR